MLDSKKTAAALKALKEYVRKKDEDAESGKAQLFEKDGEFVYLTLRAKRNFRSERSLKPLLVELPTGVFAHREQPPAVLMFTRDPQREYKDALLNGKTPVSKVVGVSKLRGKHRPYEARRLLLKDYEVFLCDDGCAEMLPQLLGATFYRKQHSIPIAVRIKRGKGPIDEKGAKEKIEKVLRSTPVSFPASNSMRVRIGTTDHTPKELAANVAAVVKALGDKVGSSLLEIGVRTNESPTLPVYFADKCYSESDIGEEDDPEFESEGMKRRREEEHLDEILAQLVDEEEIKEYNREQKRRRRAKK